MCNAINSQVFRRKKYIPLREFISGVVMSRGNRRFLLKNLQAQIRGITIMTEGDDTGLVRLRNTSPNDLIGTILEQVRIVPEKILHHRHEFGLILPPPMQRHLTGDKIVHYVSKPW
jgi:hypothetical protein